MARGPFKPTSPFGGQPVPGLSSSQSGLFLDNFNGALNATLPNHVPERGGPWLSGNGNDAVLNGTGSMVPASNGPVFINVLPDMGTPREIIIDLIYRSPTADPGAYGIILNYVDTSNYIFMGGVFALNYIFSVDGGAVTTLSNTSWTQGGLINGQTYTLSVVNTGTSLKLYRDGVLQFTYVRALDNNIVGIFTQSNSGVSNRADFDRMRIY